MMAPQMTRIRTGLAGLLLLAVAAGPLPAQTKPAQPSTAELQQEIKDLQKQLNELSKKLEQVQAAADAAKTSADTASATATATAATVAEAPPPAPAPAVASGAGGKIFNPDISVIGNFIGFAGQRGIAEHGENPGGLSLKESEIAFQAVVDPYARADLFVSLAPTAAPKWRKASSPSPSCPIH
jgi:hypothetical protein